MSETELRIEIREERGDRRQYMKLLLTGDESEEMVNKYINRGRLYVAFLDNRAVGVCLVTDEADNQVEIKNLAVDSRFRRHGMGRQLLDFVEHKNSGKTLILGTGETPSTLRFYYGCGFRYSHRIPDFFTANYPNPIIEEGVTLADMIYLKKEAGTTPINRRDNGK